MGITVRDQSQAFIAAKALNRSQSMYNQSTSQLSTGLRILSAKDDAAGSQIAAGLNAAITGQNVALRNNSQSSAMLEAANGALAGSDGILNRMKELATQAANATNGAEDRAALNAEFKSLGEELKSTLEKSTFGDGTLFASGGKLDGKLTFQTGASATDVIEIDLSAGVKGLMETVAGKATVANSAGTATEQALDGFEKALATATAKVQPHENDMAIAAAEYKAKFDAALAKAPAVGTNGVPPTAAQIKAAETAAHTAIETEETSLTHTAESVAYFAALPSPVTVSATSKVTMKDLEAYQAFAEREIKKEVSKAEFDLKNFKETDPNYRAGGIESLKLDTLDDAQKAITTLTKAIGSYSSVTASLAAGINRLGYSSDNLTNMRDGNMAAKDSIMNADAVAASTAQNTAMLLMQSGIKALSKNTQMGQMVAQLF
ncbi:flagellin N-terminal helical domain-containing protein [Yersinia enterocolitica]|uniref:Flagellin n=1 Tax=Yersinia enterocolitica TaxID=630 RepID=A0A9P1UZ60_YEREN|nr:flagellin [Yersinia enterocolitica]EKN3392501.1 flagellar protein FlaA [Yersinia enterocolitica]EKN3563507.1 flagellar protein FlaA [Yersinia enterocolitica]EKN3600866.1 flagellar protein FlaA [Yersinia enterocolitica]EKN3830305.1 flagellar protein FlaA [Yersinia enterocolitica]EKN3890343.1 flagellar protein FlaA [Yersinia enterocolitica]